MFALIAILLAQFPHHRVVMQPNLPSSPGRSAGVVEFAPLSGAGMSAECGNSVNPNSVGSVAGSTSFNRASSATCIAGNTIAIVTGSMSTVSSNVVRVMHGSDGSGALGILQEEARTNDLLRSQELENAVWISSTFGVAAITVTANAATAPDGTLTADRLQIPAAGAGQYTLISQSPLTGATRVGSVFVRGNAQSGTLYVMQAGGTVTCSVCAYNPTTWTQCVTSGTSTNQSTFNIGSDPLDCGGGAQGAKDVFAWGAQSEIGTFATSYIATVAAAATRALDGASIGSLPATLFQASGSSAATFLPLNAVLGGLLAFGPSNRPLYFGSGGTGRITAFDSTNVIQTSDDLSIVPGPIRAWSAWSASTLTVQNVTHALSGAGAFDGTMQNGSTSIEIGNGTAGAGPLNGIIKQVCLDPNPGTCR